MILIKVKKIKQIFQKKNNHVVINYFSYTHAFLTQNGLKDSSTDTKLKKDAQQKKHTFYCEDYVSPFSKSV